MFETSDLNTIKTLLNNKPESVVFLEVDENSISKRFEDIKEIAFKKKIKIEIKKFKNPKIKINIVFKPSEPKNIEYLEKIIETKEDIIILLLDHITDPNNLGSILRTSLGGLVDAVVVPKSRACHLTKSVREVSKGSSELIPFVIVPNLKRITEMLKLRGFLIYGAEGGNQSKSIYDTDFSKKVGLIIGSENTGIQETLKSKCDKMIKIPISNKLESLNAAIATSVIVFEINRQRIN
mgnify:FL=1